MASEAPPRFATSERMNRWTFEPLLLLVFGIFTFASGLFAFAFAAAGMSGVFAVVAVVGLWVVAAGAWALIRGARNRPQARDKALNYRAPSLRQKRGRGGPWSTFPRNSSGASRRRP